MPSFLISKYAEDDKINKYDDFHIGIDSKKRPFQPGNAVFLQI